MTTTGLEDTATEEKTQKALHAAGKNYQINKVVFVSTDGAKDTS